MTPSSLFRRYEALCRQQVEVEVALTEVRRQLRAAVTGAPKKRRGAGKPGGTSEAIKTLVGVLRASETPMVRREIANQLGISGPAAGFRIAQAMREGYVQKVNHGKYACAPEVPPL